MSSSKDVCRDELSLQSWPCCYTRPVRLSAAPGAFEGRCEGEWREPGHENDVRVSSSSLLGIKLRMPATLFSLVLKEESCIWSRATCLNLRNLMPSKHHQSTISKQKKNPRSQSRRPMYVVPTSKKYYLCFHLPFLL